MFAVEMLPAGDGDCLWVEWGSRGEHRMLIDAGRAPAYRVPSALLGRIARLDPGDRTFDLVVGTHMDVDHLQGLVALFEQPPDGFRAEEVWFNAWRHLTPKDRLGYRDADRLSAALATPQYEDRWNRRWRERGSPRGAAAVAPGQPLPVLDVEGLQITLLSPTRADLSQLRKQWPAALQEADPEGGEPREGPPDRLGSPPIRDPYVPLRELAARQDDKADPSVPNRSSIAFLASYEGVTVLFGADAHADVLAASLDRLPDPVSITACKVPHHGSRQNVKPELLSKIQCGTWLVSTNGDRYAHPDRQAIGRLLVRNGKQTLVFNYRERTTEEYGRLGTRQTFGHVAAFRDEKALSIRIELSPKFRILDVPAPASA